VPDHWFFRQGISLRRVLVPGRFVSQGFDKLISKNFNIGPFISIILNLNGLLLWLEIAPGIFNLLGAINILEGD
jgi:hypothetical protein